MMKKTMWAFAALAAAAASFASAENLPQQDGNSGIFPGLQEVKKPGVKRASKNDDEVKFIYVAESANIPAPAPVPAAEPQPLPQDPVAAPVPAPATGSSVTP